MASTGITSTAGVSKASKTGTIAKTGGATSPLRCASIGSLVAAAYSASRSWVTSNRSSSVQRSRPVSSNSSVSVIRPPLRRRSRQGVQLVERLVELLDAVLLDCLTQRTLDQRPLEVAENTEFRALFGRVYGERELGSDAG